MNELLFSNLKTIKGYTSNNAAGQMVVTNRYLPGYEEVNAFELLRRATDFIKGGGIVVIGDNFYNSLDEDELQIDFVSL